MANKLCTLVLNVPFKRAGNVISQKPVSFDLHSHEDHYTLTPLLSEDELLIANLPTELAFRVEGGKAVSLRGIKDNNLDLLQDAIAAAKEQAIVLT